MNPQNSNLAQALIQELANGAGSWFEIIFPFARSIFFTLVGFQLLWNCITYSLGKRNGDEFISMLFILVVDVGFFYSLILHPEWILDIINSFRQIGSQASNLSSLSPDAIADNALKLSSGILKNLSAYGIFDFFAAAFVSSFVIIAILAAFAFIAARMVLVIAEIFLAVNLSPLLLAFSGLSATKYIATQYVGYVIGASIQLVVMYLLIGSGLNVATSWAKVINEHATTDPTAIMLVGLTATLYAVLVWNLPKIIAGLSSGAPQMSSGGYAALSSSVGNGMRFSRSFARTAVDGGQSIANTTKAANMHYKGARESGVGKTKALTGVALTVGKAVTASGVNSITGRYGRKSVAERVGSGRKIA